MGIPVDARSFYPYLISISVAGQVIFLPVVGAIADFGHRKKELLGLMALLGSAATIALSTAMAAALTLARKSAVVGIVGATIRSLYVNNAIIRYNSR